MSIFSNVSMIPKDMIFGINEAFQADMRSSKINLGIGVYHNEDGNIPLLKSEQLAEQAKLDSHTPHSYLPIDGLSEYNLHVKQLLFGYNYHIIRRNIITIQTLGGTGALKIGADLIKRIRPKTIIAISDPSWENHRALFEASNFSVQTYRYYDYLNKKLDYYGLIEDLNLLPSYSMILLQACCHNPTGVDLKKNDWLDILNIIKSRKHIPFFDCAYQGFGHSLYEDAFPLRLFANSGIDFLVASSFSKSFSLYSERVGALSIVIQKSDKSECILSQLKNIIRTNYSNPPNYGAKIVATILKNKNLSTIWEKELNEMRNRIYKLRLAFVEKLMLYNSKINFHFIEKQRGMFSYSGLTSKQVEMLKTHFGIYILSSGRICIAALNSNNLDRTAKAIANIILL